MSPAPIWFNRTQVIHRVIPEEHEWTDAITRAAQAMA